MRSYWRDICGLYARLYQCYVVFVNRVGDENGARYWGGSRVINPAGEVIAQCAEDDAQVLVSPELDLRKCGRAPAAAAVHARRAPGAGQP